MTFNAQRNSFFTIAMPQYTMGLTMNAISPDDVISLSVVEELGKSIQGSLELNDPEQMYARILRLNAQMQISFGYKALGVPLQSMFSEKAADSFTSYLERRGLNVIALNPSGSCGADGLSKFSCGFLSQGWFGEVYQKEYTSGSKFDCVSDTMTNMHSPINLQYIHFPTSGDKYDQNSCERQFETDFQFLNRLASDWRCTFHMGFTPDGRTFGMFYSEDFTEDASHWLFIMHGIPITSHVISWKYIDEGSSDMQAISYDWRNEEGENGEGDNVQIKYVNGAPVYQRYTMVNDKVALQTLDMDRVAKYAKDHPDIMPVINAVDFKSQVIQQFWTSSETTTAPNGVGYTISIHMFGNPALVAGTIVTLNKGFPSNLTTHNSKNIKFIIRKITHTVSMQGYFMDLDVVDLATLSAVGVR